MAAGEWGLLLILSVLWGTATFFNALAAPMMVPLTVAFLIPASSLAPGVSVLGESLTIAHLAGLALIALGMLVADGRLSALRIVVRRRVAIH